MTKYRGYGAALKMGNGASPEVFTAIPYLKDFDLPLAAVDKIEVTTHDSTGAYKEYLAGFKDTGVLKITVVYDPANYYHQQLDAKVQSGTACNWKVVLPDSGGATYYFSAYLADQDIKAPVDKDLTAEYSLQITGAITRIV